MWLWFLDEGLLLSARNPPSGPLRWLRHVKMHGNHVTLVPCAAGRFLMDGDDAETEFATPSSALNKVGSGR